MSNYDTYVFILCLIVYVLFTAVAVLVITVISKQMIKLIKLGAEDEKIKTEYNKSKKKNGKIFDRIFSVLLCAIVLVIFSGTIYINTCNNTRQTTTIPSISVVKTSSMAKKYAGNKYLVENNLNDQIGEFDIILTYKPPKEEDLKLYDIVVYQVDDIQIVHRIVSIEEPNANHPNERWFRLQGDAVETPDRFPVRYEQIKGIYKGEKVSHLGSFVLFMQSPAGWLCLLLVVVCVFATPFIEKKINKEKENRLIFLGIINEQGDGVQTVTEESAVTETVNAFGLLKGKKDNRLFGERISGVPEETFSRYQHLEEKISYVENVKCIESKTRTFKVKSVGIVRFAVRGKTLNAFLALNPADFTDSKYIFTDVSQVKKYSNYPMRVKVTSNRQLRWTEELIDRIIEMNGLKVMPKQQLDVENILPWYASLNRQSKTFKQKLDCAPENTKQWYAEIEELVGSIDGVRAFESKQNRTFKKASKPIIKFAIRGKTVSAYLGLSPQEYTESKYIFTDASAVKKYANYPMRIKLTSNRQVRYVKELINKIIKDNGFKITKSQENAILSWYASLSKTVQSKTFEQKLDLNALAKERYASIEQELLCQSGVRLIKGKKQYTFKQKTNPIARMVVRGKTLNVYLALNPAEFAESKYIFTDASNTKRFNNYTMRVKVSSNRQLRWVKELIALIFANAKQGGGENEK